MPKGVYNHKPHKRCTKEELKAYVEFTFRKDISEKIIKAKVPHQLAVALYYKETGITIPASTAYNQKGRWEVIDGVVCQVRKTKVEEALKESD